MKRIIDIHKEVQMVINKAPSIGMKTIVLSTYWKGKLKESLFPEYVFRYYNYYDPNTLFLTHIDPHKWDTT